jgi:hypothetical protein
LRQIREFLSKPLKRLTNFSSCALPQAKAWGE